MHGPFAVRERRRSIGSRRPEVATEEVVAVGCRLVDAARTRAARIITHDDAVARANSGDLRTDAFDDTRAFVAEHDGLRNGVRSVAHRDIGMADAGRDQADEHFVRPGVIEV